MIRGNYNIPKNLVIYTIFSELHVFSLLKTEIFPIPYRWEDFGESELR